MKTCKHDDPVAQRDRTILLLLARLGLRASEVVHMTLDDIDWDAGELTVRGKGGRQDKLPLPRDVSQSLAEYLQQVRPKCACRNVFIRSRAPHRGFAESSAIGLHRTSRTATGSNQCDCRGSALAPECAGYRDAPQRSVFARDRRNLAPPVAEDHSNLHQSRYGLVTDFRLALAGR